MHSSLVRKASLSVSVGCQTCMRLRRQLARQRLMVELSNETTRCLFNYFFMIQRSPREDGSNNRGRTQCKDSMTDNDDYQAKSMIYSFLEPPPKPTNFPNTSQHPSPINRTLRQKERVNFFSDEDTINKRKNYLRTTTMHKCVSRANESASLAHHLVLDGFHVLYLITILL